MTTSYIPARPEGAAAPAIQGYELPRADMIRARDAVEMTRSLLSTYDRQQRAALDALGGEVVTIDQEGSRTSSSTSQIAERRKTARMYLIALVGIIAIMAAGVVGIAYIAGAVNGGGAFAGWLALTGSFGTFVAWRMFERDAANTPEGITHRMIDAHENVALYQLETQRITLENEHDARMAAAEAEAARVAELRRQALVAERQRAEQRRRGDAERRAFEYQLQMAPQFAQAAPVESADDLAPALPEGLDDDAWTPDVGTMDAGTVHGKLRDWLTEVYAPGGMGEGGAILAAVPWGKRSDWSASEKAAARRLCCVLRPVLIQPPAKSGDKYRLRVELFPTLQNAIDLLAVRDA